MTFDELLALLKSTGVLFAAAGWETEPAEDHGVLRYNAFDPLFADDKVVAMTKEAVIILTSAGSGEESAAKITAALNSTDITYWLESVDYNEDTRQNEWVWAAML